MPINVEANSMAVPMPRLVVIFPSVTTGIRSPHYVRMVFRFIIICRLRKEAASSLLMKKNIPLEKTREYFLPRGYHMFTILLQVSGLLCLPLSVVP